MPELILILISAALTVYVGMCAYFFAFQNKIIFKPSRSLDHTPAKHGIDYENLKLCCCNNEHINAWYAPCVKFDDADTILFFHGNDGNMSDRMETLIIFKELGFNTLMIDYRGYGASQGFPSELNSYEDGEIALNYLIHTRKIPSDKIILFGRSLGGGIATELASTYTVKALVLESTYTSIPDAARDVYPWLPIRFLVKTYYDNLNKLKNIYCPLLVVHSEDDEYIPFKHGRKLYESHPKQSHNVFLKISGTHSNGFLTSGKLYINGLKNFFNSLIKTV